MDINDRLSDLDLTLPPPPSAVGLYRPAIRTGALAITSGQLPLIDGILLAAGKVPTDVTLDTAVAAARQAVLNCLSALAAELDGLQAIQRVIRLNVFVNSSPGFTEQARVANGASELLVNLFGPAGQHTRCAVGVAELPLNAPVELDLLVEVAG